MQISFQCPKCSNVLQAESSWSGQQTQCPYCKNVIIIPAVSAAGQQQTLMQPNISTAVQLPANSTNKDFFLDRLFSASLDILRSIKFFQSFKNLHNIVARIGAILYLVLAVFLFIAACIKSADSSNGLLEFFHGAGNFMGIIVFALCSMSIFKLYNNVFTKEKEYDVPIVFLNITAAIQLCTCIFFTILGIIETCTSENGLSPLFKNLFCVAVALPVFLVSISPSMVLISTGEKSARENAVGILFFILRSALYAVPFLWCFDALRRTLNMLTHLGAEKSKFLGAYEYSNENIFTAVLLPVLAYLVYIFLDFIISAVKNFADTATTNNTNTQN